MSVIKHFIIRVYGRVQGVFYRRSSKEKADELGLVGFARNEPDGSVYIEVEGDPERLAEFRTWCATGPTFAQVTRVEASEGETRGYTHFEVKR